MLIRYIEIDDEWDRGGAKLLDSENREDYAETVKMLRNINGVFGKDGWLREVKSIEYSPAVGDCISSIDVYLGEA